MWELWSTGSSRIMKLGPLQWQCRCLVRRGYIQVCTYEYDGVKVFHEHWHAHDEAGRGAILREAADAINEGVFGGRAEGIVRLVEKTMECEGYESDMRELSVPMEDEGRTVTMCNNPLFVPRQTGAECDTGDGVHEVAEADCMAAMTPQAQADEGGDVQDATPSGELGLCNDPPPQREVAGMRSRLRPRGGDGMVNLGCGATGGGMGVH